MGGPGTPGRWQKGQSGNPGGRPKVAAEVKAAAQLHGMEAIEVLASLMKHADPAERRLAAIAMLDRAYGKPAQDVNHEAGSTLLKLISSYVGDPDA